MVGVGLFELDFMDVEYREWFVGGVLDISALLMYAKSEYLIGLCRVMNIVFLSSSVD